MSLTLTSSAFEDNQMIPTQYTCDSENSNPPLEIGGVPEGTESFVLVMDDPDIPKEITEQRGITVFDHWVLYNIPADTREVENGYSGGEKGKNSRGETGYVGPCPPAEYEPKTHRYIFRLYALPDTLSFDDIPTLKEVEDTAKEKAIAHTTLTGVYTRAS